MESSALIVFPASAGMIPYPDAAKGVKIRVPRKRGDDPTWQWLYENIIKCSPQARG